MNSTELNPIAMNPILLVDDSADDVQLILSALKRASLKNEVITLRDGSEALDYLYRRGKYQTRTGGDPVVVLLDNHMPKVNGLEVLQAIKADEHLKTIPVVVLTSSRETPDLIEFYKHGVNAYVVKPVDYSDFITAVSQLGVFWAGINEPPPVLRLKQVPGEGLPESKEPNP